MVVLAVGLALVAAHAILNELYNDLHQRKSLKTSLTAKIQMMEKHASEMDPGQTAALEERLTATKRELLLFDHPAANGILPYDRAMIVTVWFAALFPLVMIIAFYVCAKSQINGQNSSPARNSSSL